MQSIWRLEELPAAEQAGAGGKAATLARLAQAGYPVPAAFVIMPAGLTNDVLTDEDWAQVRQAAEKLRNGSPATKLAVRSSALGEDSGDHSYAGAFESVLNVSGDESLRQAVEAVLQSSRGERAAAYARAKGAAEQGQMAVLVQRMAPAEYAGVLFTADPVTGSRSRMMGNYVNGLGDALVSGEQDGRSFSLSRPSGAYEGPAELRRHAGGLHKLARRLEAELGGAQDIEWAIAGDRIALLQARPITTMQPYDPNTGEWNSSRQGDYLWSNANFGEAIPGVMTPFTWSTMQIYGEETMGRMLPGNDPFMGNIAGRFYINLSLFASLMCALGFSRERMNRESEEFFGNLPQEMEFPIIHFSRPAVMRSYLPFAVRALRRRSRNLRELDTFTADMPARIAALFGQVEAAESPAALAQLWAAELEPLLRRAYQMLQAGTSRYENAYRPLHRRLAAQAGEEQANRLLSGVNSDGGGLASLGPLLALRQVAGGEISREAYMQAYGHRGEHEFELSWPRPAEDPEWLDRSLATLADTDPSALLSRRESEKEAAWERYAARYPKEAGAVRRKLSQAAAYARGREAIRSEIARLLSLIRAYALRAGELAGLGEQVFFLHLDELLPLLSGGAGAAGDLLEQAERRRQAYLRQRELPPYPALISGRFDPYRWAAGPHRRSDVYDSRATSTISGRQSGDGVILGLPGSAGLVEGVVRVLHGLQDGEALLPGEILVTTTTNIGWTPLFPRAAAIVTDVGAPLSHAAIVARELGIPAVVGTGRATMALKSGDTVRVNGARGTVELLAPA